MKINEIQCIKELRNGSYQAFTQIYEAYADRLYSFVLKQLKNRSLTQDIVQDTFLRLWDNRNQLNSFGNLQAFIFTIAKHQVIDYFTQCRQSQEHKCKAKYKFSKRLFLAFIRKKKSDLRETGKKFSETSTPSPLKSA